MYVFIFILVSIYVEVRLLCSGSFIRIASRIRRIINRDGKVIGFFFLFLCYRKNSFDIDTQRVR